MLIGVTCGDEKSFAAASENSDFPDDAAFFDLRPAMREFDELYASRRLEQYQRHEVISRISLLDFLTLQRLHERWQVMPINPEDLRAELFGAVSYWERTLREAGVTHLMQHTIAPHWTFNYSLMVAAKLIGLPLFTVFKSGVLERPVVHAGMREEVEGWELGTLDHKFNEFFEKQILNTSLTKQQADVFRRGQNPVVFVANVARFIRKAWMVERAGTMMARLDRRKAFGSKILFALYFIRIALVAQVKMHLQRRIYRQIARPTFSPELETDGVAIAYFAHLLPEAAACPNADHFHDFRLTAAELIERGFTVYYKEHPLSFVSTVGSNVNRSSIFKTLKFYRDLAAMGVRFVTIETDNNALLEKFDVVATNTGTVALQAVAKGKLAIVFGAPWYTNMPGTIPARKGLSSDAAEIMKSKRPTPEEVRAYVANTFGRGVPALDADGGVPHLIAIAQIAARYRA